MGWSGCITFGDWAVKVKIVGDCSGCLAGLAPGAWAGYDDVAVASVDAVVERFYILCRVHVPRGLFWRDFISLHAGS